MLPPLGLTVKELPVFYRVVMQSLQFCLIQIKNQQQLPARQFQLQFLSLTMICYSHELQFDLLEISLQVRLPTPHRNTHLIRHLPVQAI